MAAVMGQARPPPGASGPGRSLERRSAALGGLGRRPPLQQRRTCGRTSSRRLRPLRVQAALTNRAQSVVKRRWRSLKEAARQQRQAAWAALLRLPLAVALRQQQAALWARLEPQRRWYLKHADRFDDWTDTQIANYADWWLVEAKRQYVWGAENAPELRFLAHLWDCLPAFLATCIYMCLVPAHPFVGFFLPLGVSAAFCARFWASPITLGVLCLLPYKFPAWVPLLASRLRPASPFTC